MILLHVCRHGAGVLETEYESTLNLLYNLVLLGTSGDADTQNGGVSTTYFIIVFPAAKTVSVPIPVTKILTA